MPTQTLLPDALLAHAGWAGTPVIATIDEDPDTAGGDWLDPVTASGSGSSSPTARVSFPTPTGNPSGVQTFKARLGLIDTLGTSPTARIDLYEGGVLRASGAAQTISSAKLLGGQVISQTFDLASTPLTVADGSGVEAEVVVTASSGTPSGRRSASLDSVNWDTATYAEAGISGSGSPLLGTVTASGAGTVVTPISGTGSPLLGTLAGGGSGTVAAGGGGSLAMPNRTYETVIEPWVGRLTSTVTRDTTVSRWGGSAAKVVTPGAAGFEGIESPTTDVEEATVAPSTQYTVSVYCKAPVGSDLRLRVSEHTSGGSFVINVGSGGNTGTGDWVRLSMTWTTSATCERLRRFWVYTQGAQALTFHVDGWQLDQAASAQTYDGADATSGISGTGSPLLGTMSATAAGKVGVAGTGSPLLGVLTSSGAGTVVSGDTTPPVTTLGTPTRTTISRVPPYDFSDVTITTDEAFVEYELRRVPAETSTRTEGGLIETAVVAATTSLTATITDDELIAAGGAEGENIVKGWTRDAAGNWSTSDMAVGLYSYPSPQTIPRN